jgi:tetratricopeptide (TPR) repeat protein
MTTTPDDFDRFSARLDEAWMRERLRAKLADLSEDDLLRDIGRADPLGAPQGGGWWRDLRRACAAWPARLSFAGAAVALLVIGFLLGRGVVDQSASSLARTIPPLPAYRAEATSRLGIVSPVNPRSEEKFRAAMAFHGTRDFPGKALPLLREAVAFDASNDLAQFWLGVALLQVDQPADAVAPLKQAVRLAPADVDYKQYLLFAYLRTGAIRQASSVLVELMRGGPRR